MVDFTNLDAELLLDGSGSMTRPHKGSTTRWQYGRETLEALVNQVCAIDKDGIAVTVFRSKVKTFEGVTGGDTIDRIYREVTPMGNTNTADALEARLNAYFARKAAGTAKPLVLLVMTDGAADEPDRVVKVIVDATMKMDDDSELAISFIQVGNEKDATDFLTMLDDGLMARGAKFDIVDTLKIEDVEDLTPMELIEKTFED